MIRVKCHMVARAARHIMPVLGRERPDCGKENAHFSRSLTVSTARVDSCGPVIGLSPTDGLWF